MREPNLIIDYRMYKPSVYIWKRDEEFLYIGQTTNPFARLGTHDVINHFEEFKQNDIIEIYNFETQKEAKDFEADLITQNPTKYNINGRENYGKAQKLREEMIAMHASGMSYRQIEAKLGFKKSTVSKVIRGEGKHTLSRGPYTIKQKRIKSRLKRKEKLQSLPT